MDARKRKAIKVISTHYRLFNEDDPVEGVSLGMQEGNVFDWDFTIIGPKDTHYEGGVFKGKLKFPNNYPYSPPEFSLVTPIYHPNFYPDGKVCISILHPPGKDKYGYEKEEERWRPVHTVSSIMRSILTLFADPNDESPANVDAGIDWRDNRKLFIKKVNKCVRDSLDLADGGKKKAAAEVEAKIPEAEAEAEAEAKIPEAEAEAEAEE